MNRPAGSDYVSFRYVFHTSDLWKCCEYSGEPGAAIYYEVQEYPELGPMTHCARCHKYVRVRLDA